MKRSGAAAAAQDTDRNWQTIGHLGMQGSTHHDSWQTPTHILTELHLQPEPCTSCAYEGGTAAAGMRAHTRTVGGALQPPLPRSFRGWGALSDSSMTGTDERADNVRQGTTDDIQADHTPDGSIVITDVLTKEAEATAQLPARSGTAGLGVPMARHGSLGQEVHHPRDLGPFLTALAQLHLRSSSTSGTASQGELDAIQIAKSWRMWSRSGSLLGCSCILVPGVWQKPACKARRGTLILIRPCSGTESSLCTMQKPLCTAGYRPVLCCRARSRYVSCA